MLVDNPSSIYFFFSLLLENVDLAKLCKLFRNPALIFVPQVQSVTFKETEDCGQTEVVVAFATTCIANPYFFEGIKLEGAIRGHGNRLLQRSN